MSMNKFPMTAAGAAKLGQELHDLKTVARPKIINDIATARAHGDLKKIRNIMLPEESSNRLLKDEF